MASPSRWMVPGIVLAAGAAGLLFLGLRPGPEVPSSRGPASIQEPGSPEGGHPSRGPEVVRESPSSPVGEASDGGASVSDEQSGEANHLVERMAKLVRDLEYTPGLPEPVQQTVRPPPEPWRPDPVREGPSPVVEEI
ncbi:MAG: hypothetical protein RJA59_1834, partial [Pseudomonadota bacterium]